MATGDRCGTGSGNDLVEGHYARKQLFCRNHLISWVHRTRFETALRLVRESGADRMLDYGCGDGTLIALLAKSAHRPGSIVGCEVASDLVEDCRTRLGHHAGVRFVLSEMLETAEHAGRYDLIICMDVLEHVVDVPPVLRLLRRLLGPSGCLVISVPVETGVPLLVKQSARRIAGWRGIGDYPGTTPYTVSELLASVFAGAQRQIVRPVLGLEDGRPFHDHKGFNWMRFRDELARVFRIDRVLASPVPWLPPQLSSQVWFVTS